MRVRETQSAVSTNPFTLPRANGWPLHLPGKQPLRIPLLPWGTESYLRSEPRLTINEGRGTSQVAERPNKANIARKLVPPRSRLTLHVPANPPELTEPWGPGQSRDTPTLHTHFTLPAPALILSPPPHSTSHSGSCPYWIQKIREVGCQGRKDHPGCLAATPVPNARHSSLSTSRLPLPRAAWNTVETQWGGKGGAAP